MGEDRQRSKDDGAILNVRISSAKMATLKHLSQKYGVSVSSIVTSMLAWAEAEPEVQRDWFTDLEALRTLLRQHGCEASMIVEEITVDLWPDREEMCERLVAIGYVESYRAIRSKVDAKHMICSYKLTTSGMLVAKAWALCSGDNDADGASEQVTFKGFEHAQPDDDLDDLPESA